MGNQLRGAEATKTTADKLDGKLDDGGELRKMYELSEIQKNNLQKVEDILNWNISCTLLGQEGILPTYMID